jgi:hypothetical protein
MTPLRVDHRYLLFCLCLVSVLASKALAVSEVAAPQLPADEDEARRMLAEGTLDSALWNKIEPFYVTPICVPQGELRILQNLFPDLPRDVPSSAATLSKYRPWDKNAREDFFSDYPAVRVFGPLLSFEQTASPSFPARIGFYFSQWGSGDTARHYALFSAGDRLQGAQVNGRVNFTNDYGRWENRSITVAPIHGTQLSCGNFNNDFKGRLLYGYFPRHPGGDTTLSNNWLYGDRRTWNGASMSFSTATESERTVAAAGGAFFHAGATERIEGIEGTIAPSKIFSCFGGASYLTTIDSGGQGEAFRYVHAGIELNPVSSIKCELQSALDVRRATSIPWRFSFSHRSEHSGLDGALTMMPKGFSAPRSQIGYLMRSRSEPGDTLIENLFDVDFSFSHRQSALLCYAPGVSCIFAGERISYLAATIALSGRARLYYHLAYTWQPIIENTTAFRSLHQGHLSCSYPFFQKFTMECSNSVTEESNGYWRYRCMITPLLTFADNALEMSPLFLISGMRDRAWEKNVGMRQKLELYKKTYSEVTIEQQLPTFSWETFRAQGRMSFLF